MAQYQLTLAEIAVRQHLHADTKERIATWWRTDAWWDKPLPHWFFQRVAIGTGFAMLGGLGAAWLL